MVNVYSTMADRTPNHYPRPRFYCTKPKARSDIRGESGPGPLGAPGPDVKVRGERLLHDGRRTPNHYPRSRFYCTKAWRRRGHVRRSTRSSEYAFVGVAFVGVAFVGVTFVGVAFVGPPAKVLLHQGLSEERYQGRVGPGAPGGPWPKM